MLAEGADVSPQLPRLPRLPRLARPKEFGDDKPSNMLANTESAPLCARRTPAQLGESSEVDRRRENELWRERAGASAPPSSPTCQCGAGSCKAIKYLERKLSAEVAAWAAPGLSPEDAAAEGAGIAAVSVGAGAAMGEAVPALGACVLLPV